MEKIEIDENLNTSLKDKEKKSKQKTSEEMKDDYSSISADVAQKIKELEQLEKKQQEEADRIAKLRKEIESQSVRLDKLQEKTIKAVKKESEKETKEHQRPNDHTHEPSLIMLFKAFKDGYREEKEIRDNQKAAMLEMMKKLNAVDVRNALHRDDNVSLDGNDKFIFVANDNGKMSMSIVDCKDLESFTKNDENFKAIIDKAAEQEEKGLEKTTSYAMMYNKDGESLEQMLKDNGFDAKLTSIEEDKIKSVYDIVAGHPQTSVFTTINGDPMDKKFEQKIDTPEPTETKHKLIDEISRQLKEKYNMTDLKKEDLMKLVNGECTSVLKLTAVSKDGEELNYPGRLFLKVSKDGISLKSKVYGDIDVQTLKNMEMWKGYKFSKEDKDNLLNYGSIGKSVEVTAKNGQKVKGVIGYDKETNNLVLWREDAIRKKLSESKLNMTKKNIDDVLEGKVVRKNKLLDNKGVPYSGYVVLNPADLRVGISPKKPPLAVVNEHKAQVKANNDGARNEELKKDKSSTVKEKQIVSDDPKPQKSKGRKI